MGGIDKNMGGIYQEHGRNISRTWEEYIKNMGGIYQEHGRNR